jgi:hypothetical protein
MKKTATEKAERESASRSSSSRSDTKKPKGLTFDLRLRYHNRMTLQRVYPLIVEVPPGVNTKGPTGVTVELRPVVAGAVVTPAFQRLDVTRPGARAIFQVAPLVRGRLPAAHVEVVHEGRTIQELRMGMKAGTQRRTWLLLLLTLVVPPVFFHYTVFEPLRDSIPLRSMGQPQITKPEGDGANAQPPGNGQPEGDKPAGKPQEKPGKPPVGGEKPGKPPVGPPPGPPGDGAQVQPSRGERTIIGNPGESLEYRIKSKVKEVTPELPYRDTVVDGFAWGLGIAYQRVCEYSKIVWPGLWLSVFLVIATCASWFLNLPSRRKSKAQITLPSPAAVPTLRAADDGETLPLTSGSPDDVRTVQASDD